MIHPPPRPRRCGVSLSVREFMRVGWEVDVHYQDNAEALMDDNGTVTANRKTETSAEMKHKTAESGVMLSKGPTHNDYQAEPLLPPETNTP